MCLYPVLIALYNRENKNSECNHANRKANPNFFNFRILAQISNAIKAATCGAQHKKYYTEENCSEHYRFPTSEAKSVLGIEYPAKRAVLLTPDTYIVNLVKKCLGILPFNYSLLCINNHGFGMVIIDDLGNPNFPLVFTVIYRR
jgi:hypothetical protein